MKIRVLGVLLLLAAVVGCSEDERGVEKVDERPDDIVPKKLCATLFDNIMSMFPESRNNKEQYGSLFSDTVQQKIVLTKDSEVYVSFVSEGASTASTLGWYAYDEANPPSRDDIEKDLIFPHVSNAVLQPGDTRQLGTEKFKAGTVIGFFLIVSGYYSGTVNFRRTTMYTDNSWNPNSNRQHVLFQETECGDIVLGFEDKPVSVDSDADYNDIIFTVSDNDSDLQTVSFDLRKVVGL